MIQVAESRIPEETVTTIRPTPLTLWQALKMSVGMMGASIVIVGPMVGIDILLSTLGAPTWLVLLVMSATLIGTITALLWIANRLGF